MAALRNDAAALGRLSASQVIGSKFKDVINRYADRDVILYALGIGVTLGNPTYDPARFLYEGHHRFAVYPTYAVTPAMAITHDSIVTGNFNGFQLDPKWIVLGEQYLEVFRPLPPSGEVISRGYIADIIDKGKSGIVIAVNIDVFDRASGVKYAFTQAVFFVRGHTVDAEPKLKRSSTRIIGLEKVPDRTPDATAEEKISADQAATFRLSSARDNNPLHIDDGFARSAGYPLPPIHGVGLLGYAVRHALGNFCGNEVDRFKAVKLRVTCPVFPGDVIRSEMWRENDSSSTRIHIRMTDVSSGKICVDGAYVDVI